MARIVILGAGVMGSAMAVPAAANGHQVSLVGTYLDSEIITSVKYFLLADDIDNN